MNGVIQKRKRRFWSFCLALLLAWMQLAPQVVYATAYTVGGSYGDEVSPNAQYYHAGDTFTYPYDYGTTGGTTIKYYDKDGTTEFTGLAVENTDTGSGTANFTVAEYPGGQITDNETFRGWAIKQIYGSSGVLGFIYFQAAEYEQFTITYDDGGADSSGGNPPSYYAGKEEIPLADASKAGYEFAGWYTDSAFSESSKVTAITKTMTGDITLYARFLKISNITYELNGGTIADGANPATYTEGLGVGSLVAPEKTGYTFVGWYSDAAFTTPVTSISAAQTGDLTLYAKFTPSQYIITYDLDGGENGAGNPEKYTYGDGVASFDPATKTGHTFGGWYDDAGCTAGHEVTGISATQTGNVMLYAKFTVNTYTINYVLNGGTNASGNPTGYTYGEGVAAGDLKDATKTGYTFGGWYSDAAFTTQVTSISTTQAEAVTLYAKFTVNDYTITYELDGGTNGAGNPTTYTYGVGVTSFADATKTGYTFGGWYSDAAFTTRVTSISATQAEDVTLYAKFTVNDYTITYELDGGTNGAGNPEKYTYGEGVASFADATKTGYTFGGWYSDAAFTTGVTEITATQTEDITLYAKFTANDYTISYVLDGGTNGAGNPESYTCGIGVASFENATKTGYTFGGWYSDAAFTTEVTEISTTQTEDITLYAKFTVNDYTITYELDGGTNGVGNPSGYTYGTGVTSFADATKTGYTFGGWYDDAGCTAGHEVTGISATQTEDITLYAKFTVNTYTINYELDGGTNDSGNPTGYTYGVGVAAVDLKDATKTGYTFGGWYSDAAFTTAVTSISTTQTEDMTLHAKFTANQYNITYHLDGGTNGAGNPEKYTYGTGVTSFADATKTGYTFGGWYSDATFTTEETSISATQTEDMTLYAKFTVNTYTISYVLNGGTNGSGNATTYTYGVGVASFADATKTGYTFGGWYDDAGCTAGHEVTSILATQTENVTLYAKFTANDYTISYVLDGGTNGAGNPESYTCGIGVASFENATKMGYTFGGWYSDAAFTTEVTSIPTTQTEDITLYAKFMVNDYTITYNLDGGINDAGNPTGYVYGLGVASFADATKTGYTFEGWYSDATFATKVTNISGTQTGNLTLYAKFTLIEIVPAEGVGSISVGDVYYGKQVKPVVASVTNGTENVTITYKKKGAADSTYTTDVPEKVGQYTARAVFAKTATYKAVTATTDFSISYLPTPQSPYDIDGTKGKNEYYTSAVTITPGQGYLIADALDGAYQETLKISKSTDAFSVYLKKADTGEKTAAIQVTAIKIDKKAPSITGAEDGETVYGEKAKLVVKDANLSRISVNGKKIDFSDGKATLLLYSNRGEEAYEIIGKDLAGNTKKITITVAAEWTKKKEIPSGEKVKLYKNRSYKFGSKSFKVEGDETTYAGNTTFYVGDDGEYVFSEAN